MNQLQLQHRGRRKRVNQRQQSGRKIQRFTLDRLRQSSQEIEGDQQGYPPTRTPFLDLKRPWRNRREPEN